MQGGAADFVTISPTRIALSPKRLNDIEAASMASVGAVAIITLRDKARLRPGERLLDRGAAGGGAGSRRYVVDAAGGDRRGVCDDGPAAAR